MNSILVTGGTGFIGSHTCLLLLEKGYTIYIIDSFKNSSPKSIERVSLILKNSNVDITNNLHLVEGDIRNKSDIEKLFQISIDQNNPIEAVIHFAGLKAVYDSIVDPLSYWENNVSGTINLLKVMEKYNCRNIVFSSSATVYKAKSSKLLSEDDLCSPVNPYGNTKLNIEKILNDVYSGEQTKWRISCLRYFNPVGAHPSGLIGENPLGQANNLYPQITRVAIGKLKCIKIFGSDWPTIDGTGVRDYIHVMDLAEGHLFALEYLMREKPQIIKINLGTGKGTSVLQLINTFEKVNNVKIPYIFAKKREGDNASVVAENKLAKILLKWSPSKSIEDICRDGYLWQRNNPNGYF